ncbi:MAG: hypothetical protein JKY37_00315 [Nannocystaceae bacterium]|nr:hypothetical protein [Nannocystaceae bacterium]
MISPFEDPRLQREFSPNAWTRGQHYFRDGHVGAVQWSTTTSAWQALVHGTEAEPYEVVVRVWEDKGVHLSGTCTCASAPPCKHQAAVLCALREYRPVPGAAPSKRTRSQVREKRDPGEDLVALRGWTQALADDGPPPQEVAGSTKQLIYMLEVRVPTAGGPSRLVIEARSVFVRKSGELGKSAPYDMRFAVSGYGDVAKYVSDYDRLLWFRLTRLRSDFRYASPQDPGFGRDPHATRLFLDFVETGRCHIGDPMTPPLCVGEPRQARIEWRTDDSGRQRLAVLMSVESEEYQADGDAPTTEDAPAEDAAAEDVPGEDAPGEDAPGEDAPGEDAPEEDAPEDAVPMVEAVVLPLSPLYYFEASTGKTGPLRLDLPERLADALVDLPVLEPETVEQLPPDLVECLDELGVPRPTHRPIQWQPDVDPAPRLWLGVDPTRDPGRDGLAHVQAVVSFDYGAVRVEFGPNYEDDGEDAALVVGLEVLKATRDVAAEGERLAELGPIGMTVSYDPPAVTLSGGLGWTGFREHAVPQLRTAGWTVDIEEDFPVQALGDGEWYMELSGPEGDSEVAGVDWFSLELGVEVEGVRVNLLPAVVDAIRSGRLERDRISVDAKEIPLRLADGRWVSLPSERLSKILDTLVELFDDRLLADGRLQMTAADGGRLLALDGFAWHGDSTLKTLAEQLTHKTPLPSIAAPEGLKTELPDYQLSGLQWLGLLREHGFGGVLADDMGLGKTVQTLAHLLVEKNAGRLDRPCLVVAPRTVLHNWIRECERFTPGLSCALFHGPDRGDLNDDDMPDVVVTTYALLHRDEQLCARQWHIVVLDEAQAIKNPQTAVAQAARTLDARQRLCLTGTPMENHLEELWSLLTFSTPGLLGSRREFSRFYRGPIERQGDSRRFAALSARVAPFLLRRTKAQVLSDLPPKTESILTVPLGPKQRDLYESVRMTMEKRVRDALHERGLARSQIVVLDALLKLRQVCCHPSLVKTEMARRSGAGSAKTDRLMELLTELLAAGRRTIIFSQFTSMLDVIGHQLDAADIQHQRITGKTRKRQEVVDAFQAGGFPVLLVSLKAGGTGINLTAADVVIHYDPWWNPAVEEQATDRAHRIGQTRPVTVYRLVCEGTVEQGVLALQDRKRALTDALQRAAETRAAAGLRLAPADVELLLAPIDSAD